MQAGLAFLTSFPALEQRPYILLCRLLRLSIFANAATFCPYDIHGVY